MRGMIWSDARISRVSDPPSIQMTSDSDNKGDREWAQGVE